ncbi:hypothetical protein HG530_014275 [Fusarium avenaceum]|nr:hypothetical protein HG530_014275 [Fusarium avenaceum]
MPCEYIIPANVEARRQRVVVRENHPVQPLSPDDVADVRRARGNYKVRIKSRHMLVDLVDERVGEDGVARRHAERASEGLGEDDQRCGRGDIHHFAHDLYGNEGLLESDAHAYAGDELVAYPFGC